MNSLYGKFGQRDKLARIEDVEGINKTNIQNLKKRFPFLPNLLPILNEYQRGAKTKITQNNTQPFTYQYPGESSGGGGGGD